VIDDQQASRNKRRHILGGVGLAVVCSMSPQFVFSAESAASCANIGDNMQRLACYDSFFGKGSTVQPTPPTAAKAQTPAQPTPAAPSASEFGGEFRNQHKDGPKRLNAVVTDVTSIGQGLYRLKLDNGQVWDTTQADWALAFHPSNTVTISRMMLGNYLISRAGGGRSVAVKRVQ
jgi:hypothetical protein